MALGLAVGASKNVGSRARRLISAASRPDAVLGRVLKFRVSNTHMLVVCPAPRFVVPPHMALQHMEVSPDAHPSTLPWFVYHAPSPRFWTLGSRTLVASLQPWRIASLPTGCTPCRGPAMRGCCAARDGGSWSTRALAPEGTTCNHGRGERRDNVFQKGMNGGAERANLCALPPSSQRPLGLKTLRRPLPIKTPVRCRWNQCSADTRPTSS